MDSHYIASLLAIWEFCERRGIADNANVCWMFSTLYHPWRDLSVLNSAATDVFNERVQAQAAPLIGSLHGGDPNRAEQASERVRDVIAQKHGCLPQDRGDIGRAR